MGDFTVTELDDRNEFGVVVIDGEALESNGGGCSNSTTCCDSNSGSCTNTGDCFCPNGCKS